MKKHLLAFLMFSQLGAYAQIEITSEDLPKTGTAYLSLTNFSQATSVLSGGTGTGQQWDFSGLTTEGKDTSGYISPIGTPFYGDFPTATQTTFENTSQGKMFFYLKNSDTFIQLIGLGIQSNQLAGNPNVTLKSNTPLVFTSLPISIGHLASSQSTFTGQLPYTGGLPIPAILQVDSIRISVQIQKYDTVDASGSIKTPVSTYDALKLKTKTVTTTSLSVHSGLSKGWVDLASLGRAPIVQAEKSHVWWAKGIGNEVFRINFDSTSNTQTDVAWFDDKTTVGLRDTDMQTKAFLASPNPTKDILTVHTTTQQPYDLIITNLQGTSVLTENNLLGESALDLSTLQQGLYVLHCKTAAGITSQKILVQ